MSFFNRFKREKTEKEISFKIDLLSIDFTIDVQQEYRNISKHKRKLVPIVRWDNSIFINGLKLEDVFVPDEFFNSLENDGKFPMFTCTCGIFGCGGYYVDIFGHKGLVIWITEFTPFVDRSIEDQKEFVFTLDNIIMVADELVQKLDELNLTLVENGYESRTDTEKYKRIVENRKKNLLDNCHE